MLTMKLVVCCDLPSVSSQSSVVCVSFHLSRSEFLSPI